MKNKVILISIDGMRPDEEMGDLSLLDLAPTIASILGLAPSREWEHASRSIMDRM